MAKISRSTVSTLCLTYLVGALLLPHGREVVGRDEDAKEVVEGRGVDEHLQPPVVEAEGTQDVGEGGQDLTGHRNLRVKREFSPNFFFLEVHIYMYVHVGTCTTVEPLYCGHLGDLVRCPV